MSDEQDVAEGLDEEMVGTDPATSDEEGAFGDAPDRPVGLPFADADVTDESLAERVARENPDFGEQGEGPAVADDSLVIVDTDLVERIDAEGDLAEPD